MQFENIFLSNRFLLAFSLFSSHGLGSGQIYVCPKARQFSRHSQSPSSLFSIFISIRFRSPLSLKLIAQDSFEVKLQVLTCEKYAGSQKRIELKEHLRLHNWHVPCFLSGIPEEGVKPIASFLNAPAGLRRRQSNSTSITVRIPLRCWRKVLYLNCIRETRGLRNDFAEGTGASRLSSESLSNFRNVFVQYGRAFINSDCGCCQVAS